MRRITIVLPDELYAELRAASAAVHELTYTPEVWAQEAVESALATRRLPNVRPSKTGAYARRGAGAEQEQEQEREPEPYPVHLPPSGETEA